MPGVIQHIRIFIQSLQSPSVDIKNKGPTNEEIKKAIEK